MKSRSLSVLFRTLVAVSLAVAMLLPPIASHAVTGTGVITADTLTVREGPGTGYKMIGYVYKNSTVTVTGSASASDGNTWYKIPYVKDGSTVDGYISSRYVSFTEDVGTSTNFEEEMTNQGFPESYKPYLRALHAAHPNWTFVAFKTNLNFETAISNECTLGRNLTTGNTTTKSSWKSLQDGAFDWVNNRWVVLDGTYWVQASEELIRYFMDPRNFLDDENIFQFELLTYSSSQSINGVNAILKGTFMYNANVQSGMTYAQAFMKIGQALNVSPYLLATRVRQEQGVNGTSPLISGTYSGYEGYYNYFNIGAAGTGATLITKGLSRAKSEGWNTRYKSLYGGAQVLVSKYISQGQDTLYLQKFDVESSYNGLYWHQYMQNVQAAYSESRTNRKAYNEIGIMDNNYTFKIPVYNNMPAAACPQPTVDGNPNNKLSSLSVSGYSISPSFNKDVNSYTLTVANSVSSITVSASAYASTSSIGGTGSVSLQEGINTVRVRVTAQSGAIRDYIISVTRQAGAVQTPSVSSNTLTFKSGYVYGASEGGAAASMLNSLSVSNGTAALYTSAGSVQSGIISTGDVLKVYNSKGAVSFQYTVVLLGDVNGDGQIASVDYIRLKKHMSGALTLTGASLAAADLDGDGSVNTTDYIRLRRYLAGTVSLGV